MTQEIQAGKTLSKYAYIDALRGIAILLVIAAHAEQQIQNLPPLLISIFEYGQLGVQLFFVTSALTLCLSMRERNETNPIIKFFIRRFFRIAPLYYFGIALYLLWNLAKEYYKHQTFQLPDRYSVFGVLENIFFLHGFDPGNFDYVVPGGWSIAVEMFFYTLFPSLFFLQNKLGAQKFLKFTIATIGVCFVLEFLLIFVLEPILIDNYLLKSQVFNDRYGFLYCLFLNQISVFLIGIVAFQNLGKIKINFATKIAFILLTALSWFVMNTKTWVTGINGFFYPILSAIAFLILVNWMSNPEHKFDSVISRILVQIGRVSFSMYLLQFLFIDVIELIYSQLTFTTLTTTTPHLFIFFFSLAAVTFIFSHLTFYLIEKPGIAFGNRIISRMESG